MKIKVICFAAVAEITGKSQLEISGCQSISELRVALNSQYPQLQLLNYAISLNRTVIHSDQKISVSDEIAILPPFSGG